MAVRQTGGLRELTVQEAQNAGLGQAGALLELTTTTCIAGTDKVFVAIQFLEDTTFNSSSGLVAENDTLWPNTPPGAIGLTTTTLMGDAISSSNIIFPAGMTIYGRWTSFILAGGAVIAYVG